MLTQTSNAAHISLTTRVLLILHLCIVFTLVMWKFLSPFVSEHFSQQERLALFQNVLGVSAHGNQTTAKEDRDAVRFKLLSPDVQEEIATSYSLEPTRGLTGTQKLQQAWRNLAWGNSPFIQAWILFSIILGKLTPVLILLK